MSMEGRKIQVKKKSGLPFSWVSRKLPDFLYETDLVLLPLGQVFCATWWVFWKLHLPELLRAQRITFCNPSPAEKAGRDCHTSWSPEVNTRLQAFPEEDQHRTE